MTKQFFLHVPVADVPKSVAFYKALGYKQNTEMSDETSACFIISETLSLMLSAHAKFRQFTPKAICDTTKETEALFCLSCETRQEVDDLVRKALAVGGTTNDKPEDLGFMYSHSFVDLDGHQWGLFATTTPPPKP